MEKRHRASANTEAVVFGALLAACGSSNEVNAIGPDAAAPDVVLLDSATIDIAAIDAPADPNCLSFCGGMTRSCAAPDTEFGTATITETTPTGCSLDVKLAVSGTVRLTLDCASRKVCLVADAKGCIGSVGICYPADLAAPGFSYRIQDCNQGSLSCW